MLREPLTFPSLDGLRLEGELVVPDEPRAGAVLTHPHPRHGGNMRSMVPGELIHELPAIGVATLRFNFRGMGASEGHFEDGVGERLDAIAAIGVLHDIIEGLPLVLCGSSFGADTALTADDDRVSGWCGLAPPLRDHRLADMVAVAHDPRPKLLIVPERDQFRDPTSMRMVTADWASTTITEVPGADHFFVGRLEVAIAACVQFVDRLATNGPSTSPGPLVHT